MIKFLSKIIYDLMEKNKTGKYSKYTFGARTLVVFGHYCLTINTFK